MQKRACQTELLVLPDGRVLAQNITPAMALVLGNLNPTDPQFAPRMALAAPVLRANADRSDIAAPDDAPRQTGPNEPGPV